MRMTGTTQHPPRRWIIDHGWMLLTMTPILISTQTAPGHASSQPPNIRSTLFETLFVQRREIVQCRGYPRSSEWIWVYGVGVSVMRFPRIFTLQYSRENSGCGVLLRVRYMRVSSTNSDGECTLYFICRRDEAKFSESWRWGLLCPCTILRSFVKRLLQT